MPPPISRATSSAPTPRTYVAVRPSRSAWVSPRPSGRGTIGADANCTGGSSAGLSGGAAGAVVTAFTGSTTPQPMYSFALWSVRCAVCSIQARTWLGFQSLCAPTSSAASPATYGAAKLVPLSTHCPPRGTVESMSTPGAATSTKSPYWEK